MSNNEEKKNGISRRQFLKRSAAASAVATAGVLIQQGELSAKENPTQWDKETDVIVIGAGATGLPAAIVAREAGAKVILVEASFDIGGHAIVSKGNIPLGGGTSAQKKAGIHDSPDLLFQDLTDWSIVQPNGFPDYRYNDREIIRAFADNSAPAFEWLVAHGVVFVDKTPDTLSGMSVGNSVPRVMHASAMHWPTVQTGKPVDPTVQSRTSSGSGLMRTLEVAAKKADVQILLEHKLTDIYRHPPNSGRVRGIAVDNKGTKLNIRARKAVIIATGGSSGNVNFRRMFDPRLTEEYCGLAGMPWSDQDASGEIAAMGIGASLWGLYNQTGEFGDVITKPGLIGCQYNYRNLQWMPGSPVFNLARASGLRVADWQNVILVNMLGKRFYDETGDQFTSNNAGMIDPYVPGSYLNAANIKYKPNNFINAALAGIGDNHNGGGPIWAIFDADAVRRERWNPKPPNVDMDAGFFFAADTIPELATNIAMKYQRVPMPSKNLEETVARYNSFVDTGKDEDFGKPTPKYKIARPPFYAAWATPVIHDTRAGLRINAKCQVQDMQGKVIPGLYCGGESAGGFSQHGLARAICQGYIAGRNAAAEKTTE
ncbi:FAD-dependent oxidoreductase [Geotalea uraniireducens]|uniref:Fumarate reductase/succinate dehydrogenase flavoprotein domain protein n=1 Tax=Geotalea uraniireducens (strain Rf4) TaxID=351605 RepID=A5GBM9_GEOUR|nr:FAD-dependent oxidoreductase [Geotalea uraniireducens]ABQ25009.1 fumarate reductase/succinate dehydrogenase flavoprotein domain protein [Geotalea uraniireducens Rf4]